MKIQQYINNRNRYRVDHNYQRPRDAWSAEDKQCLIDTILRKEPMPMFFLNHMTDDGVYYVVDGQQRLSCIEDFYDNKIRLSRKFSGEALHGKTFNGKNPLGDSEKEAFLEYELNWHIMEDYDDERVRLIFSRLQRGRPLSLGEILNAKPGTIVGLMRELTRHAFIRESTAIPHHRYGLYPDVARMLFYENRDAKASTTSALYEFFETNRGLTKTSQEFREAKSTLDFLGRCFPADPGRYKFLEKHAWVVAVYMMVRDLRRDYSLHGLEETIHRFVKGFHSKVYDADFRRSDNTYQKFYDNVRGGWSEKIIRLRRDTLKSEFLKKHSLEELDPRRQISDEDKIAKFSQSPNCEKCGCAFKDHKEARYHHKIRHTDGGKSVLENIMILCDECHVGVHRSEGDCT